MNPSNSHANVPERMNADGGAEEDENMEEDVDEADDDDDIPVDNEALRMGQEVVVAAAVAVRAADRLPLVRPRPNPPRNVLQYLDLLSIPRQNNRNDPRIEALATEGVKFKKRKTTKSQNNFFCFSVLLGIFSFLDDLSLASVSRVCRRWKNIVQTYTSDEMWCQYTKKRWPLFQEIARVPSWLEVC